PTASHLAVGDWVYRSKLVDTLFVLDPRSALGFGKRARHGDTPAGQKRDGDFPVDVADGERTVMADPTRLADGQGIRELVVASYLELSVGPGRGRTPPEEAGVCGFVIALAEPGQESDLHRVGRVLSTHVAQATVAHRSPEALHLSPRLW